MISRKRQRSFASNGSTVDYFEDHSILATECNSFPVLRCGASSIRSKRRQNNDGSRPDHHFVLGHVMTLAWIICGIYTFVFVMISSTTTNGPPTEAATTTPPPPLLLWPSRSFPTSSYPHHLNDVWKYPDQPDHLDDPAYRRYLSLSNNITVDENDNSGSSSSSSSVAPNTTNEEQLAAEQQQNEEQQQQEQQLSVDVSFEDILKTVIFLMASWMMAVVSQLIGLPSLVGEIVTGFILGPPLLDFVAYPEAMVLIGTFGLISLLLDSGINLDIAQLRETGSRAVIMAVTGTLAALSVGLGMGYAAYQSNLKEEDQNENDNDGEWFRSSFAVGAAFAPSSFGVASQVLSKGEILNTPMGQVIVAASVCDDILGLILLSIMEVLVAQNPTIFDYILPFLASFGYLIVLGIVGITYIPRLVEEKILPKFSKETTRDFVGFSLLFILLAFYLPLMHYSGASYLTGAFLAGLSFSQINSVHAQYLKSGPHLKIWLMRIFFAATIGFQVPVQYFTNGNVLNWGFLYVLPVLSKIPLGFMVPRFSREVPDDFPYDPYWKDVIITMLAFMCRGEFNFIVAAFALSAGVLDPEQYAAVVFAVLLSAVFCPLILTKVIRYYNHKFKVFLESKHKLNRIGKTNDGTRPLFLAIQARTPVRWGIQESFVQALEQVGLLVIDHRSWHTLQSLGHDAIDITEIFCQDTIARVRIRQAFKNSHRSKDSTLHSRSNSSEDEDDGEKDGVVDHDISSTTESPISHHAPNSAFTTIPESPSRERMAMMEDLEEQEEDQREHDEIELRKQIVRDALVECLGRDVDEQSYAIVVSQWQAVVFDDTATAAGGSIHGGGGRGTMDDDDDRLDRSRHNCGYRFVTPAPSVICSSNGIANIDHDVDEENAMLLQGTDVDDEQFGVPMLPSLTPRSAISDIESQAVSSQKSHTSYGADELDVDVVEDDSAIGVFRQPTAARRHRRSISVGNYSDLESPRLTPIEEPKLDLDLWDVDQASHDAVSKGCFMEPTDGLGGQTMTEGFHLTTGGGTGTTTAAGGLSATHNQRQRRQHRRIHSADSVDVLSSFATTNPISLQELENELETSTIKDRLHGYIR